MPTLCGRRCGASASPSKKTLRADERQRPDVVARRDAWATQVADWAAAGRRLIFLDETGAKTNFVRRAGWSEKGARCHASAPFGHWNSTTVSFAIDASGVVAAFAYPGATDAAAFRTFVEKLLLPELRRGDVLILDHLAAHGDAEVARRLAAAGVELAPLPPYSPDLNPIENIISKVKNLLRQAAARTYEALVAAIGTALAAVTASDCANAIRHAGYANKIS
jgi:transposase